MNSRERDIRRMFAAVFTEEGVEKFLAYPNPWLDDRTPQDLLDAGEYDRLQAYAENLLDGSFS